MSSGESSSYFPVPQNRVVHATSLNYADPPADAHKSICFLGSGIAKDSHLLEKKEYCSILALILKKCLYRQKTKPSASPHPGVVCEHQHVPSWGQPSSKAVGEECWVTFLMKHVASEHQRRLGWAILKACLVLACIWTSVLQKEISSGCLCACSVFLSWLSSCARLTIWVLLHDNPHSVSYAFGREEEPAIMNKLAITCFSNSVSYCVWVDGFESGKQDFGIMWKILHALNFGLSLSYILRHPWLQSGCLREMGLLWG